MKIFLSCVIAVLLLWGDLFCSTLGLSLYLILGGALYVHTAYGPGYGTVMALLGGGVLDGMLGRRWSLTGVLLLLLLEAGAFLIARCRRFLPEAPLAAGAAAGFLGGCADQLVRLWHRTPLPGPDWPSLLLCRTLFAALGLLVLTALFDLIAHYCDLPGFTLRERHKYGDGR